MKTNHIFSPHIDDAFLSLGGSILQWKQQNIAVKIHNVFSVSSWVDPNYPGMAAGSTLDAQAVTELRKKEERTVAAYTNVACEYWDFLDYPLREQLPQEAQRKTVLDIFARIVKCLNEEDNFFFPASPDHPDHLLLYRLSEGLWDYGLNIRYFEDMPYFSRKQFDHGQASFSEQQPWRPVVEKIDYPEKVKVLRMYGSQMKESWFQVMGAYAYNPADNQHYERYWIGPEPGD